MRVMRRSGGDMGFAVRGFQFSVLCLGLGEAAPAGLVDGFALGEPVFFEVGLGVGEGVGGPGEAFEGGAGGEVFDGVLEVFFVVGFEEELAGAGFEDAFEAGEEFLAIDEAVFVVAFFGPGVGAEEVEAGDAGGGEEPGDGVGAFEAHDFGIGAVGGEGFAGGFFDTAFEALDGEEVAFGMDGGDGGGEGAVAAAEVDLEGSGGVGEDFRFFEVAEVIGWRKNWLHERMTGCVGCDERKGVWASMHVCRLKTLYPIL